MTLLLSRGYFEVLAGSCFVAVDVALVAEEWSYRGWGGGSRMDQGVTVEGRTKQKFG